MTEKTDQPEPPKSTLRPGEVCMFCFSVGLPKPTAKAKPACHRCGKPFTRSTPWRLHRGHRCHVACIAKPYSQIAAEAAAAVAPVAEAIPPAPEKVAKKKPTRKTRKKK